MIRYTKIAKFIYKNHKKFNPKYFGCYYRTDKDFSNIEKVYNQAIINSRGDEKLAIVLIEKYIQNFFKEEELNSYTVITDNGTSVAIEQISTNNLKESLKYFKDRILMILEGHVEKAYY